MTDVDSVRSLDRVTAEWLTGRLRAAGHMDADVASMLVQRTDRGDQLLATMASRHAIHVLDLGASEFLR